MKTLLTIALISLAELCVPLAQAHDGPRVWVASQDGRIVTETSDDDYDPTSYSPSQVFTGELSPNFGTYTTQFPGFEAPRDGSSGIAAGTGFGFKIAGPLLTLNAARSKLVPTADRFAGQPSIPQLAITFPDVPPSQAAAYTRFTSGGVVAGYDFTNTIEEHTHLAFTFLGNGTSASAAGPDGVYVLPIVLTSPSMSMSKWFFLTFRKNATEADATLAASFAQTMATARPGDTNFDGAVNFDDLVTLAQNYNTPSGAWWGRGDFNIDGTVGFDDLVLLAQNYRASSQFGEDWGKAQSLVPEPACCAILLMSLVRRRR